MAGGVLGGEKIMAFVAVTDGARARAFYRDTLGLRLSSEDSFALVFDAGGTMLRAAYVADLQPQPYTVLGWQVSDVRAKMRELAAAGVMAERYAYLEQDEDGVWLAPGGAKIAWFKDPDGHVLSVAEM